MENKIKLGMFCVFIFTLAANTVNASSCQGAWGDDSATYPVPTSFSQFSDSDTVGLNCHLSGSQCPVPQIEGTCDTSNQGFMECNIQVRDSSGTWTSIAKSTNGENCDFDDDTGSNFASVSNFMINHDDVTDIRCKAFVYSYDATFDLCVVSAKGHDKRDDWWYNENTPTASNVVISPTNPTTLDDLDCDYTFNDADNDSENLSAVQYKWYINDVDVGVNSATLGNNSTDVSDLVVCSVKVFDDVFVTGNEAFVNSSPVNISDANETPGTLPQRREMSLDFTDKVETSYVFTGSKRIVEISNDDKLYLHNDNVGSSSLKTDDVGAIDSEIITMPFGSTKADTGDGTSKSFFTGKETDNTGLQYFGSRYYDPTSGRFTQIDPIQRSAQSNYHYANNNPGKFIDPDGNQAAPNAVSDNQKANQIDFQVAVADAIHQEIGPAEFSYKDAPDYSFLDPKNYLVLLSTNGLPDVQRLMNTRSPEETLRRFISPLTVRAFDEFGDVENYFNSLVSGVPPGSIGIDSETLFKYEDGSDITVRLFESPFRIPDMVKETEKESSKLEALVILTHGGSDVQGRYGTVFNIDGRPTLVSEQVFSNILTQAGRELAEDAPIILIICNGGKCINPDVIAKNTNKKVISSQSIVIFANNRRTGESEALGVYEVNEP